MCLRFPFLKRLQNLLMYKKRCYLFSFTDTSWRDPLLLPVWSPNGKSVWLPFALRSGQHFLRDRDCWDGWVRSQLDAVQSSSVPQNIFLRQYLCWQFVMVPARLVLDLSSSDCLHSHMLLGSRGDIWSSTCWTNSWCTGKLTVGGFILGSHTGNCSSTLQKDFSKSLLFWGALRVWKLFNSVVKADNSFPVPVPHPCNYPLDDITVSDIFNTVKCVLFQAAFQIISLSYMALLCSLESIRS